MVWNLKLSGQHFLIKDLFHPTVQNCTVQLMTFPQIPCGKLCENFKVLRPWKYFKYFFKILSLLISLIIYHNLLASSNPDIRINFFKMSGNQKFIKLLFTNLAYWISDTSQNYVSGPWAFLGWSGGLWGPQTYMSPAARFSYSEILHR